jgi:hypothetical protein
MALKLIVRVGALARQERVAAISLFFIFDFSPWSESEQSH